MIQHTVAFRLKAGADAEAFFAAVDSLAAINSVKNFEVLHQVGKKNNFDYGLSMYFEDQTAYDSYDADPVHGTFVSEVWIPNVDDYIEIDYIRVSS